MQFRKLPKGHIDQRGKILSLFQGISNLVEKKFEAFRDKHSEHRTHREYHRY
jgi:hypothetical protein